jgi:hypothetical protein
MPDQPVSRRCPRSFAVLLFTLFGSALIAAALVSAFSPRSSDSALALRCLSEGVTNQDGVDTQAASPHRPVMFEYEIANRSAETIHIGAPRLCLCALEESPEGELSPGAVSRLRFQFDAPPAGVRRETVHLPTSVGEIFLHTAIRSNAVAPVLVFVPDSVSITIIRGVPAERMFLVTAVEREGHEPAYRTALFRDAPGFTVNVDDRQVAPAHEAGCIVRTYRCTVRYDGEPSVESGNMLSEVGFPDDPAERPSIPVKVTIQEPIAAPETIRFLPGRDQTATLNFLLRDPTAEPLKMEWVPNPADSIEVSRIGDDEAAFVRFSIRTGAAELLPSDLRFTTNHPLQPEIVVELQPVVPETVVDAAP